MNSVKPLVISNEKCRLCGDKIKMQLVQAEDESIGIRYVCACGDSIGKVPSITKMEQEEVDDKLASIISKIEVVSEQLIGNITGTLTIREYKNNIPYSVKEITFRDIKFTKPYISLIKDRVKFMINLEDYSGKKQSFLVETKNKVTIISESEFNIEMYFDKEFSISINS